MGDLINHLGTIAKSGTKTFMEALKSGHDLTLLGQFGVGFYSAYLVADQAWVHSKKNDDTQHVWKSAAGGTFTVREASHEEEKLHRGTKVVLLMKEDQTDYLEERRIKELIKKHSEYVAFPIEMLIEKTLEKRKVSGDKSVSINCAILESGNNCAEKNTKKSWVLLNKQSPIWMRNPEELTKEEYESFYKSLSNDWDPHLAVKHFCVEGQVELRSIIFVPRRAPFDMFEQTKKKNNIKVYVRRVFIMDNSEDLIPDYLTFIRGVVDSEDLPLNVSREHLQQSKILKVIKKNIVKKSLESFSEIAENKEDFAKVYEAFSKNIKLGIHEDSLHRQKLSELLRYYSTKSMEKLCSLSDYVTRMAPKQKVIYYITGETKAAVENSPFLEALKHNNLEVLLLTEAIDEYCIGQLKEYSSLKPVCVSKEGLLIESESSESITEMQSKFDGLTSLMKEILGDRVGKVIVSHRLTKSACVIVTSEYSWTANMERIMKAQALNTNSMGMYMASSKTFEINARNPLILEINKRSEIDSSDSTVKDLVILLFDTSLMVSGFSLEDPNAFAERIHRMISLGLGIGEGVENDVPTTVESDFASKMEEVD